VVAATGEAGSDDATSAAAGTDSEEGTKPDELDAATAEVPGATADEVPEATADEVPEATADADADKATADAAVEGDVAVAAQVSVESDEDEDRTEVLAPAAESPGPADDRPVPAEAAAADHDEPVTEAMAIDEPVEEEPTVATPAATKEPATDEPAATEPAVEEPAAEEPAAEEPAAEEPAAEEPAAEEPAAEEPMTGPVPVGVFVEDDRETTQVIKLPIGDLATRDLAAHLKRVPTPATDDNGHNAGERTQVIPVARDDDTQVIRLPQQRIPSGDGEQTQVIRVSTGAVEPPGERTQVITLPTQQPSTPPTPVQRGNGEPERPPSIVGAERPNPGDDPTTRIVLPGHRPVGETTVDIAGEPRVMTVMNLERPADEIADDDTTLLRLPAIPDQRKPD
jgi:hypothetical protein